MFVLFNHSLRIFPSIPAGPHAAWPATVISESFGLDEKILVPDTRVLVPDTKVLVPDTKVLVRGYKGTGPWICKITKPELLPELL